jgi:adenylate cyclase
MQKFLRDVLASQGFSVHTVSTGREAIAQAFALKPDLILLDLIMASVDGVAVCKALRTNEKTEHTPILVVTGSLSNKQIEESMTSGADDFISKPVDVQDMLVRVRALLKCRDIVDPIDRLSRYVETVREMSDALSHHANPPSE